MAKAKATVNLKHVGLDFKALKKLLPHCVVGCKLPPTPEERCLTGEDLDALPGSRARTWGTMVKRTKVVRAVRNWVWAGYVQAGGSPCPWEFEVA